ncbi:MAG: hypothetical protein M3Y45_01120 [Actinomycetota bacterium]|nr:hypothetical protein [Actinomycetota bacterium]
MAPIDETSGIESVEVIPYALPFRRPYVTARGSLGRREIVLLRVRTREGARGLGEAVPLSLRGGESLAEVASQLRSWDGVGIPSVFGGPARCAIATALADAAARELDLPLHELLRRRSGKTAQAPAATDREEGGEEAGFEAGRPEPVRCNATLTAGSPAEVFAQAESWAEDGFRTFKLKLGPEGDTGQVEALRLGLGPDVRIRIDVNATWTVDQAAAELDRLAPFGLELVEQPVEGLEAMAELARRCDVPLVADEDVTSRTDAAEAATLKAAAAVTVKLSKIGGLDAALGGHLPTYLSSALDGPVGIAAAAHVAVGLEPAAPWDDADHGLATERLFDATIAKEGPLLRGSFLQPPAGPGLGVTIDESALRSCRL